ncbi:MAG: DNA replication/repair protein RecF [Fimbriimonadaceae bacterium]|nr:DNA replication/repair protein RecF [Fimbriimonadaceae bacterium]
MELLASEKRAVGKGDRFGVSHLRVENFRNHVETRIELDPGFNLLYGQNAAGKTSILEAMHLLSTSKLLRGNRDAEAIYHGQDRAVVDAELIGAGTTLGVVLTAGTRKKALLNSMNLPRAADLIGRLPCVCFSSADIPIVADQPADRRMFLDMELSQLYPDYIRSLTIYKRAVEQRNALLKAAQERPQPDAVFEAWETEIALHGARMREHRREFVADLGPRAAEHQSDLGSGEALQLELQPSDPSQSADELLAVLTRGRGAEIARGSTLAGPHRDELLISINAREARTYGSQGQQRTAVIAIKLAVLDLATARHRATPLLLLDDIFSDLDKKRRQKLIETVLAAQGQVVLTCTDREQAGEEITHRARHFHLAGGTVIPE